MDLLIPYCQCIISLWLVCKDLTPTSTIFLCVNNEFQLVTHSCTFVAQVILHNPADFLYSSKYDRVIFIEALGDADAYEVMQCHMVSMCIPTSTSRRPIPLPKFVPGA